VGALRGEARSAAAGMLRGKVTLGWREGREHRRAEEAPSRGPEGGEVGREEERARGTAGGRRRPWGRSRGLPVRPREKGPEGWK